MHIFANLMRKCINKIEDGGNLDPDSVNKQFVKIVLEYWCEIRKKDIAGPSWAGQGPKRQLTIKPAKALVVL